jgi:Putative adhesin
VTTATGPASPPPRPEPPAAPTVPVAPPPSAARPGPGIAVLRIVGTAVALLVVAGTTLSVVSQFFHQERVETAVYPQPVTEVAVRAGTGDVRVTTGAPGSAVVVRRVLQWSFGTADSVESVTGGRLDVAPRCSHQLGFGDCSVSYEITTPPGVALLLESDTGDVSVAGSTGDLTLASDTGDVAVRDARAGTANVSTSTGDVDVRFAAAPQNVRVTSSTGSVVVQVPADRTSYDARTSSSTGSQTVTVPISSTADRHIDVRTSTGDVEVRTAS